MNLPSDHFSKLRFVRRGGLRRTIKVYGNLRDPIAEARRQRFAKENGAKPLKPHSGIKTSVREKLR